MPAFYQITFLPESRVVEFAGCRGNHYEFEGGGHLDLHTTPVWCYPCGRITHGEEVESIEEIDRQLADLRNPRSDLYRYLARDFNHEYKDPGEAFTHRHSEERLLRGRRRAARVSPPRCIHCGSTDIVVFPIDQSVPNPAGPGTVELSIKGMCSTSFNEWYFTPEGERIPRDTQPTYWHHPKLDDESKKSGGPLDWLRMRGRPPRTSE